jgi:dTDP-4-amino-4,6-dideoxygalactose transaminase
VTDQVVDEILSLPMFPEMTEEQVQYVAEQVMAFSANKAAVQT